MQVIEYLNEHFDGNKADFARAFGRQPQNVSKIFKDPGGWRVVTEGEDDYLVELKSKRSLLTYRVHYDYDGPGAPREPFDVEAVTLSKIRELAAKGVAERGGTNSYLQELKQ